MEAERLSIYFEELGAYQYKKNQELKRDMPSGGDSRGHEETVVSHVIGDDLDEEE